MAKFARIFELPNDNQLLLTIDYNSEDRQHEVTARSDGKELSASMKFGFNTKDECEKMFDNFTLENAKNVQKDIIQALE